MAKRFIDTNIFKKGFVKSLECPHKLLWLYIFTDCNHAGIWDVEIDVACLRLDINVTEDDALKAFGDKVIKLEDDKWFIPSFIEFQYGPLNPENRAHSSVINILNKHTALKGLIKGLTTPLQGCKDKDKDKDINNNSGVDKRKLPKSYEPVLAYLKEKHPRQKQIDLCAKIFFDTYEASDWYDAADKPVRNWKNKLNNWVNQGWFNTRLSSMPQKQITTIKSRPLPQ